MSPALEPASTARPNVLFITLDQFRGDCLSALGHPVARTPSLDALAAQGTLFARHYSQAAPCAPGRACLYTGTYQMNNRVVFNGTPLDDRLDNVARVARRAGYDPTLFGYTDQGIDPRLVHDPDDPRLSTYEGVLPGFRLALDLTGRREAWAQWLADHGYDVPSDPDEALAGEPDRPEEVGISAFLTDRFLDWLGRQDGPWFAHVSHLRPHPPYAAAGRWARAFSPDEVGLPIAPAERRHPLHDQALHHPLTAAPTDPDQLRQIRTQYFGMIGDVDEQLGRLFAGLRAAGQWDDTIVVLTADHGEQLGDHGLVEKFGYFEESYHIPCVIRAPGHGAGRGRVVRRFTENVDLLPTLCELVGADTPAQCDGRSLTGFLDGTEPEHWRQAACWEFDWRAFLIGSADGSPRSDRRLARQNLAALRTEHAAYVQFGDGSSLTADLAADPTWRTPLVDTEQVLALAQQMLTWRSRHLDRTMTSMLLCNGGMGRRPAAIGDAWNR